MNKKAKLVHYTPDTLHFSHWQ